MRKVHRIFAVLAMLLASLSAATANTVELRALIVANDDYKPSSGLQPLPHVKLDGLEINRILQDHGYKNKTVVKPNVATKGDFLGHWKEALDTLIAQFETSSAKRGILTFYFSGHGTEVDGENYLLTTQMKRDSEDAGPGQMPNVIDSHVRTQGIKLKDLFEDVTERAARLQSQKGRELFAIFIIDACRAPTKEQALPAAAVSRLGVSPVPPPKGIFVFYAASSGQVAHTSLKNDPKEASLASVYTRNLVSLIESELGITEIAQIARWVVHNAVEQERPDEPQTPQYFDYVTSQGITLSGADAPTRDKLKDNQKAVIDGSNKAVALHDRPTKRQREPRPFDPVLECKQCPNLVVVSKGRFTMGSMRDEPGHHRSEEGNERVKDSDFRLRGQFARDFAIGITEVTVGQFRAFLDKPLDKEIDGCAQRKDHPACQKDLAIDEPVTGVTWSEAQAYIDWLNRTVGLKPKGSEAEKRLGYYRLPTESEWEYAARADTQKRHLTENEAELCLYGNGADRTLHGLTMVNLLCSDGIGRGVARVKRYKPNDFGLYDVHGNVWEWVADCWSDKLTPNKADAMKDYMEGALDANACTRRVVRGGSWMSGPDALRLAKRWSFDANHARPTVGFRVARTLPH